MHIELTWPREGTADRTVIVAVPDVHVPVADMLRPAVRIARQACASAALRRAVSCAEPVLGSAAGAAGAGLLVQLALPFAVRMARQALDDRVPEPAAGA